MPEYTEAEKEAYQRGREDERRELSEWCAQMQAELDALRDPPAELRIGDTTFVRRGNQWERK